MVTPIARSGSMKAAYEVPGHVANSSRPEEILAAAPNDEYVKGGACGVIRKPPRSWGDYVNHAPAVEKARRRRGLAKTTADRRIIGRMPT